jgi:hypothetical protein
MRRIAIAGGTFFIALLLNEAARSTSSYDIGTTLKGSATTVSYCPLPEGAAEAEMNTAPPALVQAIKEHARWLRRPTPFDCWTQGVRFLWHAAGRWVVSAEVTGRHNCNNRLLGFDVSEDGQTVSLVASYASFGVDPDICENAMRMLRLHPKNGEQFTPVTPVPSGGGLY